MAKRGRKGYEEELKRQSLIDLSYTILGQALKSSKVSPGDKRRIALEIVKRRIPARSEHDVNVNLKEISNEFKALFNIKEL